MSAMTLRVRPEDHSLNDDQRDALLSDADSTFVTAAAGSGKTRVLTLRVARALLDERASVDSVVAITFTERAAQEMKDRIAGLLAAAGASDLVDRIDDAWISTIHGLCSRLLSEFAHAAGIDPGFSTLEEVDAGELFERATYEALEEAIDPGSAMDVDPQAARDLRARYGDQHLAALVRDAWTQAQRRVGRIVRFDAGDPRWAADAQMLDALLTATANRYLRHKRRRNALDFDDLEHRALGLLRRPQVVRAVQARFHLVLVDEFQDTNAVQCAIIDAISPQRALYVGDEWQSIYRFRGADVDVFRERSALAAGHVRLATNYRSSQGVLNFVNQLFTRELGAAYQPVHPSPGAEVGEVPRLVLMEGSGPAARTAEATWIANRIHELLGEGARARDCLVLVPIRTHMSRIATVLRDAGLEIVEGSDGFFDDPAVEDALTLLSAAANPGDVAALLGVFRSPMFDVPLDEIATVRAGCDGSSQGFVAAMRASTDGRIQRALGLVDELAELAATALPPTVARAAIDACDMQETRLARLGDRQGAANLGKLLSLAADAVEEGAVSLVEFLARLDLKRRRGRESVAAMSDAGRDAVRIMTIHNAKGLEAPYVFIADTGNPGNRRHSAVLPAGGEGRVAFVPRNQACQAVEPPPQTWSDAAAADNSLGAAERCRLMYVAMTRAERELTIVGTVTRAKAGTPIASGALSWLLSALDLRDHELAPAGSDRPAADGTLQVSVVEAATVTPTASAAREGLTETPATLEEDWLTTVDTSPALPSTPVGWPPARDADNALRTRGTQLHAAIEARVRELAGGRSATGDPASGDQLGKDDDALIEKFLAQPWLRELIASGARAELPYALLDPDGSGTSSGRMDLVLQTADTWTIVDFKSTLADRDQVAWSQHAEQLQRYARVAFAAGAKAAILKLAAIDQPGRVITRTVTSGPPAST